MDDFLTVDADGEDVAKFLAFTPAPQQREETDVFNEDFSATEVNGFFLSMTPAAPLRTQNFNFLNPSLKGVLKSERKQRRESLVMLQHIDGSDFYVTLVVCSQSLVESESLAEVALDIEAKGGKILATPVRPTSLIFFSVFRGFRVFRILDLVRLLFLCECVCTDAGPDAAKTSELCGRYGQGEQFSGCDRARNTAVQVHAEEGSATATAATSTTTAVCKTVSRTTNAAAAIDP